jgi:hydrogenase maturation protease
MEVHREDEVVPFSSSTLVLGVGNLLMGDEGVGVRAVEFLQQQGAPAGVTLLDGGTGGFHLLELFQHYDPIIFIDATMDGAPAGTVRVFRPRFASDFPRTLSAHDIGLRDLLESAQLLAPLPRLFLVAVSIDSIQSMQMELSLSVAAAIPTIKHEVDRILAGL